MIGQNSLRPSQCEFLFFLLQVGVASLQVLRVFIDQVFEHGVSELNEGWIPETVEQKKYVRITPRIHSLRHLRSLRQSTRLSTQ